MLTVEATAFQDCVLMDQELTRWSRDEAIVQQTHKVFPEIPWADDGAGIAYMLPEGISSSTSHKLNTFLNRILPRSWTWKKGERKARPFDHARDLNHELDCGPRETPTPVTIIGSTIVALSSAAVIIAPIVFMSYRPDHSKNLFTASVALIVVSFFLAAVVRMGSRDIFLVIGPYAAVLVVYIGKVGVLRFLDRIDKMAGHIWGKL